MREPGEDDDKSTPAIDLEALRREEAKRDGFPWLDARGREVSGPNRAVLGNKADRSKACICKPRDPRAYADDDGADFDCPHHGFGRYTWP